MDKEEIKLIIKELARQYTICIDNHEYSRSVDIHDEIDRWERNLRGKYE